MVQFAAIPLLVIEDCDEDFEVFRRVVSKASLPNPIFRCVSGDEALEFLYHQGDYANSQAAPRPALILLDLGLPGKDGQEVLAQIKHDADLSDIPIVVLSGSTDPYSIEECYRHGVSGYIFKPMSTHSFIENLHAFITYWLKAVILPGEVHHSTGSVK